MMMSRDELNSRRRAFLKTLSVGVMALAVPAWVSRAEAPAGTRSPFTFAQLCDTQLGMGGYEHDVKRFEQAVSQINAINPDFVLICGDLVNTPDEKSIADFDRVKAGFRMPCYCVPGNHDVGNTPTQASLQHYRKVAGDDYYAFEHQGHTFVAVNTQLWKVPVEGESAKQDAWFEATLKAAAEKKHPIFVVGHHPLFLKQPDEADQYMNLPAAKREELLGLFKTSGVVAMLGGHTHRLILNDYKGVQLVNAESTSRNSDKRPFGFRLWHVGEMRPYTHEFIPLTAEQPTADTRHQEE